MICYRCDCEVVDGLVTRDLHENELMVCFECIKRIVAEWLVENYNGGCGHEVGTQS